MFVVPLYRRGRVADLPEIVDLAANLFTVLAARMGRERKTLVWLSDRFLAPGVGDRPGPSTRPQWRRYWDRSRRRLTVIK